MARHDQPMERAVPCRRVGHSIVTAGARLDELPAGLADAGWDMVELDVLAHDGELVVAHDRSDLAHPSPSASPTH